MPAFLLLGLALLVLPLGSMAAEPIRVNGSVLDPVEGAGFAGAQVELFPAWEDYESAVRRLTAKADLSPIAAARTDTEGSFEIVAPESGLFRLMVRADGFLPIEYPLAPLVEDLELEPALITPAYPPARPRGSLGSASASASTNSATRARSGRRPRSSCTAAAEAGRFPRRRRTTLAADAHHRPAPRRGSAASRRDSLRSLHP